MSNEIDEILKFDPVYKIENGQRIPLSGEGKMPNWEAYSEAYNRGILPDDKKTLYEEAVRRGLVSKKPSEAGGSFENLSWRDALSQAFKNIPKSGYEFGKDILTPFAHPVETGKAISKTAMGLGEKFISGQQEHEPHIDAMVDFFENRYGDVDAWKQTVAKDPVGALSDIASFLMAGGSALKGLGAVSKAQRLAKAGQVAAKMGARLEPLNVARGVVASPLKFLSKNVPSKLYQSGAKFSTTLTRAQRDALTKAALVEGIKPTIKGLQKTRDMINDLNTRITGMIDEAGQTGRTIPVTDLFKGFESLKREVLGTSGRPLRGMKAIDSIKAEIQNANAALGREALSPKQAQRIKQTIYKELESYYSSVRESPVAVKAQKLIAKNAKESLEKIIPEIKYLNAKEGSLIELHDAIERSSARIRNRDILGIGIPIKSGAGVALGGIAGGAGGGVAGGVGALALGILDTPAVKARISIVLDRLRRQGIRIKPTRAAMRLGLVQAGRLKNQTEEE